MSLKLCTYDTVSTSRGQWLRIEIFHLLISNGGESGTIPPSLGGDLSTFYGEDSVGEWTLAIRNDDSSEELAGELLNWAIHFGDTCGNPGEEDCNCNGIPDSCDIASLQSSDCNANDRFT